MRLQTLAEEEDVRENFPAVLGCAVVPVVAFSIDEYIPVEDAVDRPEVGVTPLSAPPSTLP